RWCGVKLDNAQTLGMATHDGGRANGRWRVTQKHRSARRIGGLKAGPKPRPSGTSQGDVLALLRQRDGMTSIEVRETLGLGAKMASNRLGGLKYRGLARIEGGRWYAVDQ